MAPDALADGWPDRGIPVDGRALVVCSGVSLMDFDPIFDEVLAGAFLVFAFTFAAGFLVGLLW